MLKQIKYLTLSIVLTMLGCNDMPKEKKQITAADILGNPEYLAISYGAIAKKRAMYNPQ